MTGVTERLSFLINNLREDQEVEIKNWLNCLAERSDQATLAKEIIALANHGGGYVFIGFEDDEPHASIDAPNGWEDAFSHDAIANVIERYVSPPCQCEVHILQRDGEEVSHPVIVVPGNHRTPLLARRGSPAEDESFERYDIIVRRPGGKSERASTQDDWEKLIDRLVRARQSEMIDAMRGVLNPEESIVVESPEIDLEPWIIASQERWATKLAEANISGDDPRRFLSGFWYVAFGISDFAVDDLTTLSTFMDREISKYSGWPPFTYLHNEPMRPYPLGDTIEAWIGANPEAWHPDFWRVSKDGYGFLLRPYQEDGDDYGANRTPRPARPAFDWVFPIWRMTETLLYIHGLGLEFATPDSDFELKVLFDGTRGRSLEQSSLRYMLRDGGRCQSDQIQSSVSAKVGDIEPNLNEIVTSLLTPVFAQFEFTELPPALVRHVIKEVLNNRTR